MRRYDPAMDDRHKKNRKIGRGAVYRMQLDHSQRDVIEENPLTDIAGPDDVSAAKPINSFIKYLAEDIRSSFDLKNGRERSKVFLLVRGGNSDIIKNLIHYLQTHGKDRELTWLLGQNPSSTSGNHHSNFIETCSCTSLLHAFVFVLLLLFFFILTPVFYIFHSTAYQVYTYFLWKRPSKHAELPLYYALLSENLDMVRLFLQGGLTVLQQDKHGNNIYHYLADLSLDEPHQAWRCHQMLTQCNDTDVIRRAITKQTNDLGLTGFESVAKNGSLLFFLHLSNDINCISSLVLQVSKTAITARMENGNFSTCSDATTPDSERNVRVLEMDISAYEQKDILGKQSYPLQLISSRSVDTMSKHDVVSLLECKFLNNWMHKKSKTYLSYSVLGHLVELLVTLLFLVFLINQGGDMTIFPLVRPFFERYMEAVVHDLEVVNATSNSTFVSSIIPCYNRTVAWMNGTVNGCTAYALKSLGTICPSLTNQSVLEHIFIINNAEFDDIEFMDMLIQYAIAGILLTKVTLDFIMRFCFLCNNYNFRCARVWDAISPLMFRRLPGSYCERQLTLCMSSLFGVFLYVLHLLNETVLLEDGGYINEWRDYHLAKGDNHTKHTREVTGDILRRAIRLDIYEPLVSKLVVVCLLFRFIMAIHTLRLFPSIGFFIITTKKMAKHLCQFAVVFVIVSLAFAAIFHFIMRDPNCPAIKEVGFESLADSLFSAYHVAIGGSNYDFTRHLNTRIAFIIYTLISVMLLLNLIIAVMTTTAQELNRVPWRQALCVVERWDEVLGTETNMNIIILPVVKIKGACCTMLYKGHCTKGKDSSDRKHIIEVVHVSHDVEKSNNVLR